MTNRKSTQETIEEVQKYIYLGQAIILHKVKTTKSIVA